MKLKLKAKQTILRCTSDDWKSLDDISNIYIEGSDMGKPEVSSQIIPILEFVLSNSLLILSVNFHDVLWC